MPTLLDSETVEVASDLRYRAGAPVVVRLARRGPKIDLDDGGAAVRLAGRRDGWLLAAGNAAERYGLNVNRRGVVFVCAYQGRDLDALSALVARASRDVYLALLELD